ncbi:uncharacterized protein LOC114927917 isoform X2 [Nylanderia fulva]|uniref:uncharacterized protein LOC114927917 isoform X2 n=1 Tax=Nylanderia fulva TaxID=613905 RepID=UPI0010FBABC9|nr:uncharacterized protein LOC114927917 isoform X2 [Nylanderia fulva]
MTLPQFFCTIILFIGITSVKTYSVSYQNIPLAFSNTPRLIYTESESNPAFSGYSYATQDLNGGESNVIFTTGADSLSRLQHEMDSMKPSEGYSEKNIKGKKLSKSFEADNNFVEYQAPLQQISFVPYSTLRANLLNFPTVLPRYHVSPDAVQNYYLHNPYSQLKLPLHNFNLYNPIVPLFYQATTNPNSSIRYQTSIAAQNSKISLESNNTKSSEINSTISESSSTESNIIESRSDLGSMEDAADKTSNKSDISADKLELVTKKVEEEITSSKSVKSAVTETFDEQTIEDKTNTTELANTETSTSKEKSTTVSSQRRISIYQ